VLKVLTVALGLGTATAALAADGTPPPFQSDVLRLSEILGSVAYLDGLCAGPKTEDWRAKMAALLDAQKLDGPARRPFIEAFNRGQRTFSIAHRSCTSSARSLLQRYFAEGAQLADRVGQRFGRKEEPPAQPAVK